MDDLISRQSAIDHFRSIIDATGIAEKYNEGFVDGLEFSVAHLSTMPSVQPEPAVWLMDGIVHGEVMHRCSECGEQEHVPLVMGLPSWRYCPNCGLKMEVDDD